MLVLAISPPPVVVWVIQGYQRPVLADDVQKAEQEQLEAELKLDLLKLDKEAKLWQTYLQNVRAFNAETHNEKVTQKEVSRNHRAFTSRWSSGAAVAAAGAEPVDHDAKLRGAIGISVRVFGPSSFLLQPRPLAFGNWYAL